MIIVTARLLTVTAVTTVSLHNACLPPLPRIIWTIVDTLSSLQTILRLFLLVDFGKLGMQPDTVHHDSLLSIA